MITIKDIGDFESVPEIVSDIINGNTLALDKHLSEGFDIEEDIKLGKYTRLSPLGLTLNKCQLCSVLYFVYKYSL
jgi:ankyrin repeat-containing protein